MNELNESVMIEKFFKTLNNEEQELFLKAGEFIRLSNMYKAFRSEMLKEYEY